MKPRLVRFAHTHNFDRLHCVSGLNSTIDITLRYLVTISHDNVPMCDILASSPSFLHNLLRLFVYWYRLYFEGLESHSVPTSKEQENGSEDGDRSVALERVSLSLGLLTQLVKHSDVAKSMIRSISEYSSRYADRPLMCIRRALAFLPLIRALYGGMSMFKKDIGHTHINKCLQQI
jgi:hypothetical protein